MEEGDWAEQPTSGLGHWICFCRRCKTAAAGTALLLGTACPAEHAVAGLGAHAGPDPSRVPNPHDDQRQAAGVGLSYIAAIGTADVDDEALSTLQAGGHEPNRNGIPLHLITLSVRAPVTPGVGLHASVMGKSTPGESASVEVEEAYALIDGGRRRLQGKLGWFFTDVGRLNAQHFEEADFVDKPVILTRLFGEDQLSNAGLRLGWPLGTAGASTILLGVQDSRGETASSFLAAPDMEIGGHALVERDVRSAGDLLYHARWTTGSSGAAGAGPGWDFGVSVVTGPNASGSRTRTHIVGADFSRVWNGYGGQADGTGAVRWHTEVLGRRYEAGDRDDPLHDVLRDWGLVSQGLWAWRPTWVAGLRLEYAIGNGAAREDPERGRRVRSSLNLTWNPAKTAAVRLQYNRDGAAHLEGGAAGSVWLQIRFALGQGDHHDGP